MVRISWISLIQPWILMMLVLLLTVILFVLRLRTSILLLLVVVGPISIFLRLFLLRYD